MKMKVDWQMSENHSLCMSCLGFWFILKLVAMSWINAFQWDVALHCLTNVSQIFCIQWDSCTEKMHSHLQSKWWISNKAVGVPDIQYTFDDRMWGCDVLHGCPHHTRWAWWVKGINKKLTEVFRLKQIELKWPINALLHIQNIRIFKGNWIQI